MSSTDYNSEGSDYAEEKEETNYDTESEHELEAGSDVEEVIDKNNTNESEPEDEETGRETEKETDLEKKFEEYLKKRVVKREDDDEDDDVGNEKEATKVEETKVEDNKKTNELPKEIADLMKTQSKVDEENEDDEEAPTSEGNSEMVADTVVAPKQEAKKHMYSQVALPSGRKYWISVPQAEAKQWSYEDKTKVITLRSDGRFGHRELRIITQEMEKTRRRHHTGSYSGFEILKVQKVVNPYRWRLYRQARKSVKLDNRGDANEKLLYHGSPAWRDLVRNGFDERYAKVSGMFGAGLYFAENSSKSNQYVFGFMSGNLCPNHSTRNCADCERVLLLCRVSLGRIKRYTHADANRAHAPSGYNSVMGVPTPGGLLYSENIVYRGDQVYPEFIVTYKLKL